jgi:IS5 family transposase
MKNYPTREAARSAILIAGLQVAQTKGYQQVTLRNVADRCGRTPGWVCNRIQADELQDEIMREACRGRVLRVIAQGLATGHAAALALPEDVRRAAVEAVV